MTNGSILRALARLLDASYLDREPSAGQRELWRESVCAARDEYDALVRERDALRARVAQSETQVKMLRSFLTDVAGRAGALAEIEPNKQ